MSPEPASHPSAARLGGRGPTLSQLQNGPRSANGKRTAAASGQAVVVSDADRVGEDRTFPLPAPPVHVALSPDGRWLVSSFHTAAKDGRVAKVDALQV